MANQPGFKKTPPGKWFTLVCLGATLLVSWFCNPAQAQHALPGPVVTVPAYTLEDCIQFGLANQPAMKAAYSALAAAQVQQQALNKMRFASLVSQEIPIRRKQACLGVVIANAEINKVEGETIYAISRTFFTVIYAQKQEALLQEVAKYLAQKEDEAKEAHKIDPTKVTESDLMKLTIYRDLIKLKQVEAANGIERARAALREAMGMEVGTPLILAESELPGLENNLSKEQLLDLALSRRGSMIQAATAAEVVALEVSAQNVIHTPTARTFAAGSDIHAHPVPQGTSNGEYRPWAVGIEMPTTMVGHRWDRVQRAQEFHGKAIAVVEKTRQLITLELSDAYLKWQEASQNLQVLATTPKTTKDLREKAEKQFKIKPETSENLIMASVLDAQVRAKYNEALYNHALALAALERITAGGFLPSYRRIVAVPH